jgi:hypothetical protein
MNTDPHNNPDSDTRSGGIPPEVHNNSNSATPSGGIPQMDLAAQIQLFGMLGTIERSLIDIKGQLTEAGDLQRKLEDIDRKVDFALRLSSKEEQFFIAPRGSDLLLQLTQRITTFTSFPIRAIEEAEFLENISHRYSVATFALILYLSSVIAGGNVQLTSGFLWDKMFTPEFSDYIAWATIGEANQAGGKVMGRAHREKFLFRQKCPMLSQIMYHVVRRKVFNSGHEIPNIFLINEHLKLARAVCAGRSGQDVDFQVYRDQTSRSEGVIPIGMFCDDLDADAQHVYEEYHEDIEKNRQRKCITCANRKQVTKPPERKRDANVKNPEKEPVPRPNRRMNNATKVEYDAYAAFANKFVRFDQRLLIDVKEGRTFLDQPEVQAQFDEVSNEMSNCNSDFNNSDLNDLAVSEMCSNNCVFGLRNM